MRLEHPLRHARTAAIAAAIVASSVSAFGQSGQSRLTEIAKSAATGSCPSAGRDRCGGSRSTKPSSWGSSRTSASRFSATTRRFRTPRSRRRGRSGRRSSARPSPGRRTNSRSSTSSRAASRASTNGQFFTGVGLAETLPWGANYSASWNNSRFTTNDPSNTFNPRLQSNLLLNFNQPLLRNRSIDQIRQAVANSRKFRDLSDIQLDSVIVQTTRAVRNAYWDLSATINNLKAQQESLALAQQSLSDNRKRVEIGTLAPIDIVQAQAEVASNEERVIVAEALIKRAQDNLRALILDPPQPTSGRRRSSRATTRRSRSRRSTSTPRCETRSTGGPTCRSAKNSIDRSDLNVRYLRNQMLPDINAQVNYGAIGVGGVQLPVRNPLTGELSIADPISRGFGSALERRVPQLLSAVDLRRADWLSARRQHGSTRTSRARGSNTSSRRRS